MKTMTAFAMGCCLTAGSLMVAGTAMAQPGPRGGDRPGPPRDFSLTFEQAKERWPNMTQERFDALDTNGDGVLTPADRIGRGDRPGRPGVGEGPGPARDFSLTYEQAKERWPNLTQERFDAMDTDGDGVLTPADRIGRRDRPGRPGPRPQAEVEAEEGEAKVDDETVAPRRRFEGRPRRGVEDGSPRWERGDGARIRGEGDENPRGDRRPRDGRGLAPAE